MATMTDERRIYVACLHCYNSGRLHGHWIDLDGKDQDDVDEDIATLFKPLPSKDADGNYQTPWMPCGGEELMVHDHEGFDDYGFRLGEVSVWEAVKVSTFLEEFDEDRVGVALYALSVNAEDTSDDFSAAREMVEDRFRGKCDSFKDYIMESELYDYVNRTDVGRYDHRESQIALDKLEIGGIPLASLLDWDAIATNAEQNYHVVDVKDGVLIFDCE